MARNDLQIRDMAVKKPTIGILTGGGDCPGLNAAIRAVVRKAIPLDFEVQGFLRGWEGVLHRKSHRLSLSSVQGILRQGGTILQSSRTNPFEDRATERRLHQSLRALKLAALIVVGGEDTLGVAARLAREGFPIIGIPKTIDNDVMGTDMTIGFDTAVHVATDAIDRLQTTAESHNRVMVVEVMGRHAGWIAVHAGLAAGADHILIPEYPFAIEEVSRVIQSRHRRGKNFSTIVVAEGAQFKRGRGKESVIASAASDAFGHVRLGGIGDVLAKEIERRSGFDCRAVVLGYLQRGGSPSPFDRILATRYGVRAVELAARGRFGRMVALQQGQVRDVALSVVKKGIKKVDKKLYQVASTFFG